MFPKWPTCVSGQIVFIRVQRMAFDNFSRLKVAEQLKIKVSQQLNIINIVDNKVWKLGFGFGLSMGFKVPSVAEWSKALESDATAGGESPVRAPVRAATLCPYA